MHTLTLTVPSINWGSISPDARQTMWSVISGYLVIWVTAMVNRYNWSSTVKLVVAVVMSVLFAVAQLLIQNSLGGLTLLKALVLTFTVSQTMYNTTWVKLSATKLEFLSSPGGAAVWPSYLASFLQTLGKTPAQASAPTSNQGAEVPSAVVGLAQTVLADVRPEGRE